MNVRLVTEVTLFSGHSLMQQCRPTPPWEACTRAEQRIATASEASCRVNPTYGEYDLAVIELGFLTGHGHECPYSPDLISPAHAGRHRR